jgi:4'-phosphopantetheinyl transferase
METACSLPENAVHVWYTLPPSPAHEVGKELVARYGDVLTSEERARHDRFMQHKDRCQYLLGKVLVRTALSHYLPRTPDAWRFTANRFGKPVLANSPCEPAPHFNLAHTEGLVACVLSRDFEVGIDVERIERTVNLDIARRYFAPAEVAFLEQVPEGMRQQVFFLFWTLKEAYVKARGMGLSLPLEQFAFQLDNPQSLSISFEETMREDPAKWRFFLPDVPAPAHQVAVAVHCPWQTKLDVQLRPISFFPANQEHR